MDNYLCPCGYVYCEELGSPVRGIAPGTKFSDLPSEWRCPVCGLSKDYFGSRNAILNALDIPKTL